VPQIRPLADTGNYEYAVAYLLTSLIKLEPQLSLQHYFWLLAPLTNSLRQCTKRKLMWN